MRPVEEKRTVLTSVDGNLPGKLMGFETCIEITRVILNLNLITRGILLTS